MNEQAAEFARGLREMADFCEEHDLTPDGSLTMNVWKFTGDEIKEFARIGGWQKKYEGNYFDLERTFSESPMVRLILTTKRDQVCERKVVGTRVVEKPDEDFIRQARKDAPLVNVVEEVVEWECHPLLAPSED